MKRPTRPFKPTRRCPHRWCAPLHRTVNIVGSVVIIAAFVATPYAEAVVMIFSFLIGMALLKSKYGMGTHGRVAHQTAGPGGSAETEVVVDRRWATIAAAMDVLMVSLTVFNAIAIGLRGSKVYGQQRTIPADIGWIMIIAGVIYAFIFYAHWRATRPRPRRRVRVWAQRLVPAFVGGR